MANDYLQFSATIDSLTPEEQQWLEHQLEPIVVLDGQEFPEDEPLGADPDWEGPRFMRAYPYDADADQMPGFEHQFLAEDGPRQQSCLWIFSDEYGEPDQVAFLVQQFLKKFRPDQCWGLAWSATCSKPRPDAFGGGALFVTAEEIRSVHTHTFLEAQQELFEQRKAANTQGSP